MPDHGSAGKLHSNSAICCGQFFRSNYLSLHKLHRFFPLIFSSPQQRFNRRGCAKKSSDRSNTVQKASAFRLRRLILVELEFLTAQAAQVQLLTNGKPVPKNSS